MVSVKEDRDAKEIALRAAQEKAQDEEGHEETETYEKEDVMPKGGAYDKCLRKAARNPKVRNEYAYCSIIKKRHNAKRGKK